MKGGKKKKDGVTEWIGKIEGNRRSLSKCFQYVA